MKNKTFDPKIEEIYKNLSEAQKTSYINKYNIQNIIALTIPSILVVMDIVGIIIILCQNEEIPAYAILFPVFLLLCCGGIMSISIMALKSPNEVKIKRYIENLEKQKHPEQTSLKTALNTETVVSETPSTEELNYVAQLTNQLYESYSKNSELIEIINNNLGIPANILSLELFCFPIQKHTTTTKTYQSLNAKINHWEWAVINSNTNTEFKLPSILLIPETDYSIFIDKMKGIQEVNKNTSYNSFPELKNIFLLLKRQNIITPNADAGKNLEWIEKAEFTAFLFLFRCLKLQSIVKQVEVVKQNLRDFSSKSEELSLEQVGEVDELNSLISGTPKQIITALYNSNLFEIEEILNWYLVIKYSKETISTPYSSIYYSKRNEANQVIEDLKDKEKIDKLKSGKYQNRHRYSIGEIDNMNGARFEYFVAELFTYLGYKTENTKLSGDQGVDVIAKKGDKIIAIQAKHYNNQTVGNHAIMEVVAGAKMHNATLCYVVTNNYFTKSAKELAAQNNVILWDRDKLIEKLSEI